MCRTVHAVLQTAICGIQMLVRVFMTVILMIENLIRMILQTLYNFVSFILQMLSLIPICVVFLLTARLKCFMCGGGGPCPVNRGGACDCIMSALAIIILFFIFRATGVLDKIFYSLGYTKAKPQTYRFVPTPGDITECSRNDTDYTDLSDSTTFNSTYEYTDTSIYTSTYLTSSDKDSSALSNPEQATPEPTASNTASKLEENVYDSITTERSQITTKTSTSPSDIGKETTEGVPQTTNFLRDIIRSNRRWPKQVSFMI